MIYPGSVGMQKVNWKAKLEYEYLSNFKIVTTCLEKNDVKKHVDVNSRNEMVGVFKAMEC